jgi:hypothetical protein
MDLFTVGHWHSVPNLLDAQSGFFCLRLGPFARVSIADPSPLLLSLLLAPLATPVNFATPPPHHQKGLQAPRGAYISAHCSPSWPKASPLQWAAAGVFNSQRRTPLRWEATLHRTALLVVPDPVLPVTLPSPPLLSLLFLQPICQSCNWELHANPMLLLLLLLLFSSYYQLSHFTNDENQN